MKKKLILKQKSNELKYPLQLHLFLSFFFCLHLYISISGELIILQDTFLLKTWFKSVTQTHLLDVNKKINWKIVFHYFERLFIEKNKIN